MASYEVAPVKTEGRGASTKQMGCNASKPPETMNYKNVAPFNPNYPLPKPPDDTKEELCGHENFAPIDNNAKSMPAKDKERYQTLLPRLLQGTNNDVQKVRAIYSYTGSINYNDPQITQAKEGDTPTYYIKMIKDKKGDVPTFFTILCRRAGIPCVILDGLGKDKNYVPGMSESNMRSRWNAVHVNNNWRPVHVEWGHQVNGGKNKNKKDDFYFLTDPDRFVVNCFPDDYQWQLLADPLTKKEWLNLPNFRPAFFDLHMQLVKPKSGLVKAVKGKAEVEISVPPKMMDKIRVSYTLQYKGAISQDIDKNDTSREMYSNRDMESSRGKNSSLQDEGKVERPKSVPPRLERYVFLNRKSPRFHYTLTLPVAGKYLFEITGNNMEDEESSNSYGAAKTVLCQFRVLSENDPYDEDCEPYPDTPEFGWGPTPHCARLGITPITHLEGIIFINPKEKKDIKFRLSEELDFRTSLSHNYLPLDQLTDMTGWRQPKEDEMIVTVEIPEEGVFGLKIEATKVDSGQFFEIANYLLRQHSRGGVSEKVRSKMLRAKLIYAIENGPTEKALRDAMDMFDCYNVPDQGEMARAQERLEHYWTIKRELNFSCRRRNNGVLDKWIKAGRSSKYESELKEDIRQAEDMKDKLGKLHGYLHPIAKMKPKTIQEIRTYQHPKPVTKDVMTATYVLLGEKKDDLKDWTNIQVLMARTGKDGLQKRILDRRPEDVNEKDVEVADVILESHNINEAREASTGTATFYRWAKEFMHFTRSPDNSYHKEGILDKDTYRETHGISVNRHHEHVEYERHKYDSPKMTLNTGRSPELKQDTKGDQKKLQYDEPNDLENSFVPKDTQYQNYSPRKFQSKVTTDDRKPERSPRGNEIKRDNQTDKEPKNSLNEKPNIRKPEISKPKQEQKYESVDAGNKKENPKEKPTAVDKHPDGEYLNIRDAIPERKDEVTSKKKVQKENEPIIAAQQHNENKKPILERNKKDSEATPMKPNEIGKEKQDKRETVLKLEESQDRREAVPKLEESQKKKKNDHQDVEILTPDKHKQDQMKNEKQEMKSSKEKEMKKTKSKKEIEEKDINEKEREKKEKQIKDKEKQKILDEEKAAKMRKEKEEKEKQDREEREKEKQEKKEKEQERRQKETDQLKREKEENKRKANEKQELEKTAKLKKEKDENERSEKERQKREKEEMLKHAKENGAKEISEKQKKEKVEQEKIDKKEKELTEKEKLEKQKKDKAERNKREKEEKEQKEKEKEEKQKKDKAERDKREKEEKEENERKDTEKQLKEKEEKDKRDRLDKERKDKMKQEKEKRELEEKDKEVQKMKEKEAKQKKEKDDTKRKEKTDKDRQQKEEKDKREMEQKPKNEKKSEKERDRSVRSQSYYFFDLY